MDNKVAQTAQAAQTWRTMTGSVMDGVPRPGMAVIRGNGNFSSNNQSCNQVSGNGNIVGSNHCTINVGADRDMMMSCIRMISELMEQNAALARKVDELQAMIQTR